MADELALQDKVFRPTATGLIINGKPTYEVWEAYGKKLRFVEGAIQWLIGDWLNYGELHYGELYAQALDAGASPQTWMNCKYVANKFETSRRREVLSFSHHSEVASLPDKIADKLLDEVETTGFTRSELRAKVRELKYQSLITPDLPKEKYSVIYADPPWRYDYPISDSRRIENNYPTMEFEAIAALPIRELAAENSIIFLWCPPAFTKKAIAVLEEWGFEYRTNMVWIKPNHGMGQWVMQMHELLLIGRKGEFPIPEGNNKPDSVIEAPRRKHSQKPEVFYGIIEKMYPGLKRIELFARVKRGDGWDSWGNE